MKLQIQEPAILRKWRGVKPSCRDAQVEKRDRVRMLWPDRISVFAVTHIQCILCGNTVTNV